MEFYKEYDKAVDVINSCYTIKQLSAAENYVKLFKKKWRKKVKEVKEQRLVSNLGDFIEIRKPSLRSK